MSEGGSREHLFKPGQSGNPAGRGKGGLGGRAKALAYVDACINKAENAKALEKALDDAIQKKPLWFFVNIIMPLLPKESKGTLESGDRVIEWRGLVSVCGGAGTPAQGRDGAAGESSAGSSGDAGFVAGAGCLAPVPDVIDVPFVPVPQVPAVVPAVCPFDEKPPF